MTVEFRRHPPAAVTFIGFRMMLVAEAERRGGQRQVIAERRDGSRETLAWWSDHLARWVTSPDGQLWEDVRAIDDREPTPAEGSCHRDTIANPPEMAGGAGLWLHSDPAGDVEPPAEGCPTGYPKWSVSPEARLKVYRRPHDAVNGNADPEQLGNWANITNPESGVTYTITTEYGSYSTVVNVTAP